jgi:hypothetical protein
MVGLWTNPRVRRSKPPGIECLDSPRPAMDHAPILGTLPSSKTYGVISTLPPRDKSRVIAMSCPTPATVEVMARK